MCQFNQECRAYEAEHCDTINNIAPGCLDIIEATQKPQVSPSNSSGLLCGDLFKEGVLWYEKQLYDLLQSKGWGDVCSASIVSEMAEIVAKKIDR
jgi:hypothetical protein